MYLKIDKYLYNTYMICLREKIEFPLRYFLDIKSEFLNNLQLIILKSIILLYKIQNSFQF